jgi:RNA recognition motif-containing protein
MGNRMYLGNLPWATTTDDLADLLKAEGYSFVSAKVITDRETGKSRGFAFVEFETPQAAAEAIENIDGHMLDGRPLRASEAEERPGRGGGGGGGGGGSRGRSGGDNGGGHGWGDRGSGGERHGRRDRSDSEW